MQELLNIIKESKQVFLKIVSANDAGVTGGHQGGIYIPKNVVSMFFDSPGIKGENKEQFINIKWYDNTNSRSRAIYYGKGSRNEYRITRLGKKLTEGSLFVLIRKNNHDYIGYIVQIDNIQPFLKELEIELDNVLEKGLIFKGNSSVDDLQIDEDIVDTNETTYVANFKSRARLLPQLGDMLIKSEDVAFLELLKNSYDADASLVTVLMDKIDRPGDGIILIEDNGFGMDASTILDVWLELGSDFKSVQLNKLKKLPKGEKGRIPIGEKGIGRLGAHKLGHKIELISKKDGKNEVHVNIDWNDFNENINKDGNRQKKYIEDVSINVVEKKVPSHFIAEGATGTFICISDLKFEWTRGKLRNIQRTITSISSPFQGVNEEFKVQLKVLDKPGWLDDVVSWDNIKDLALYQFKAVIDKDVFESFEYKFKPYKIFNKVNERVRTFNIKKPNESNDDLILSHHLLEKRNEHNTKELISLSSTEIGKVKIEGYIFDLENYVLKEVFDKKGLKEFLKSNSGVKVFRDGMRIYNYGEPDNDWLDLNLKRVNSPGEKISNNIIVCGVFLDRESSYGLIEKTNREGFIENQHSKNFKDAVTHTIEIIELLRKFDKKELRDKYGPTKKSEPVLSSIGKLQQYVTDKVVNISVAKEINSHLSEIEERYKLMQDRLLRTSSAGLGLGIVLHEVEKVIKELYEIVRNDPSIIDNVLNLVKRLSKLIKGYSEMFSNSVTEQVSINTLMEDSLFSIEFRLRKHKIEVIKLYEERGEATLRVSKGLIEGIIINIIDNSIYWLEVAKEEHKTISNKKIFIDAIESENTIEVIFADNGTGFLIPTDRAIEPLETGKKVGLGLGLNIAHEIMLSQNGKLDFPDFMDYDIPDEFKKGALVSLLFTK